MSRSLRLGMTKEEVRSALGSPSTTATVQHQGDSFYYISSRVKTSAFLENEELDRQILAVRFSQFGQVQSFGQYTLQDGAVVDMNSRETPSRGRELTILQQMFGNLGNFTPNDSRPAKGWCRWGSNRLPDQPCAWPRKHRQQSRTPVQLSHRTGVFFGPIGCLRGEHPYPTRCFHLVG